MNFLFTKERAEDIKKQLGIDDTATASDSFIDQNSGSETKIWIGTQAEYYATTQDPNTLYMVKYEDPTKSEQAT